MKDHHLVAVKINKTGDCYLSDSLRDEEIVTTLAGINDIYPYVFGLYVFMDLSGNYAVI